MIQDCLDTATHCYTSFNQMDKMMKAKSVVVCLSILAMGSFTIWMGCRGINLWSQGFKRRSITWIGSALITLVPFNLHTREMIQRFNQTYQLKKNPEDAEKVNDQMFRRTNQNIADIATFVFVNLATYIAIAGLGAAAVGTVVVILGSELGLRFAELIAACLGWHPGRGRSLANAIYGPPDRDAALAQ